MLRIDLWRRGLTEVPEWVWDNADCEWLNLGENQVRSVSPRIAELRRLRMIDLGHNELAELPSGIAELRELADYLYLSNNKIAELPTWIGGLSKLRYLNVADN